MDAGRVLFIINPTAQNGAGADMAPIVEQAAKDAGLKYEVEFTHVAADASVIGHDAQGFDTIIAVGGDGTAHDVAGGILLRTDARPAFSIIPVGSGNDYAMTLGITLKPDAALHEVLAGRRTKIDAATCNGSWFLESASFGIDAAIALGTVELRKKTGESGTKLYFKSGVDVIMNHFETLQAEFSIDGEPVKEIETLIFCLTIGQTYGGGFMINPGADPCDGNLKIVRADPMGKASALVAFARCMKGKHTGNKKFHFDQAHHCTVDFPIEPPGQFDGEKLCGTHFDFELHPLALDVLVPQASAVGLSG